MSARREHVEFVSAVDQAATKFIQDAAGGISGAAASGHVFPPGRLLTGLHDLERGMKRGLGDASFKIAADALGRDQQLVKARIDSELKGLGRDFDLLKARLMSELQNAIAADEEIAAAKDHDLDRIELDIDLIELATFKAKTAIELQREGLKRDLQDLEDATSEKERELVLAELATTEKKLSTLGAVQRVIDAKKVVLKAKQETIPQKQSLVEILKEVVAKKQALVPLMQQKVQARLQLLAAMELELPIRREILGIELDKVLLRRTATDYDLSLMDLEEAVELTRRKRQDIQYEIRLAEIALRKAIADIERQELGTTGAERVRLILERTLAALDEASIRRDARLRDARTDATSRQKASSTLTSAESRNISDLSRIDAAQEVRRAYTSATAQITSTLTHIVGSK